MQVVEREEEIDYLLQTIDPNNNQRMTFSEIVHLLSSNMVPLVQDDPMTMIPILEKFVGANEMQSMEEEEGQPEMRALDLLEEVA